MIAERFGEFWIVRPGIEAEASLRVRSEAHLRAKYAVGRYEDPRVVNAIVQHQHQFFSDLLSDLLPGVASRDFMAFVLDQYDAATNIERLSKRGELSLDEQTRWQEIGPTFRRVAKYLAERTTMLTPPQTSVAPRDQLEVLADQVWSSAEQMLDYAMTSEGTHSVFPDRTVLTIPPTGRENYLEHEFVGVEFQEEVARIQRDLRNRPRYLPEADFIFHDFDYHDRLLGQAVEESIGVPYRTVLGVLANAISGSRPPPDGFPVPFVPAEAVIQGLSTASGIQPQVVRRILAGFTIRAEDMWKERREIWKPKQEYRALRRGFFEFPHDTGLHLTFSREMAEEAFAALQRGAIFGHFPNEWRSPDVNAALSRLANEAGAWFEKQVRHNLDQLGFYSVINARQNIGTGRQRVRIPPRVGELDYLGYSPQERLLVLLECKFVQDSPEPRFYRDDIIAFATGKQSYVERFRRKLTWVRENWKPVCEALESVVGIPKKIEPTQIAGAIVTFFPTIASRFIGDLPCVSLPEFMLDYEDKEQWPYSRGSWPI